MYVNPKRNVSLGAYEIHGISDEFLRDKPVFARIAQDMMKFIGNAKIVIHNAKFDIGFINYELNLLGYPSYQDSQVLCTLNLFRRKFPGSPASLDAICRRYKISLDSRSKHGALLDAELLAKAYLHMCGGPQQTISFTDEKATAANAHATLSFEKTTRPTREMTLTDQELQQHSEFIKKMKESLW